MCVCVFAFIIIFFLLVFRDNTNSWLNYLVSCVNWIRGN